MATFINLMKTSAPETPTRQVYRPRYEASGSNSSLQASRSYHYLHFQQSQLCGTDDEKKIDLNIKKDGRVYSLSITPATTRRFDFTRIPYRSLTEPSPSRSTLLQSIHTQSEDGVQTLIKKATRPTGQSSLQSIWPTDDPEVPFSRLAIGAASPSAKRRCVGLQRSLISGHEINPTASPYSEAELKDAEREDDVIDLTISDNFPTWNYSKVNPKGGILNFLKEPDSDKKNSNPGQRTSHSSGATDTVINLREVEFSRRLAAAGVKRRLAALGRTVRINPRGIIDLSADSAYDEDGE
jgi:hypothetical protein